MRNCIIATAGHVDHGKSALIEALTGQVTDRLLEEQNRKITIDLGFAELKAGEDESFSIIDVPGHKDFIKNMLAGASSVDFLLLVVALDEGVMPQTIEHFNIMSHLNVQSGIVVLTKSDLVDEVRVQEVRQQVTDLIAGSCLENIPFIEVSAHTGDHIDDLSAMMVQMLRALPDNHCIDPRFVKLPIHRVFSVDGMGTVVTGSLADGSCTVGDTLYLYPSAKPVKVRGIQTHGLPLATCCAGQRIALNVSGINRSEIRRGDMLMATKEVPTTSKVAVSISVFEDLPHAIRNNTKCFVSWGSRQTQARLVLLEDDSIMAGGQGYALLHLSEELPLMFGDKVILSDMTHHTAFAGCCILENAVGKPKRRDDNFLCYLEKLSLGNLKEQVNARIEYLTHQLQTADSITFHFKIPQPVCQAILTELSDEGFILQIGSYVLSTSLDRKLKSHVFDIFGEMGMGDGGSIQKATLIQKLQAKHYLTNEQLEIWFEDAVSRKEFFIHSGMVSLHECSLDSTPKCSPVESAILTALDEAGFKGANIQELQKQHGAKGKTAIHNLLLDGKILKLSQDVLISRKFFDQAFEVFHDMAQSSEGVLLPVFRDALGTSRKPAQILLESFDARGLTRKEGDVRFLRN